MVFLGLFAYVNTMWAQLDQLGNIDLEDPSTWFYINLTARISDPDCGTSDPGKVYLIFTDAEDEHAPLNPLMFGPKPANPYDPDTQDWPYRAWGGAWDEWGFIYGSNAAQSDATYDDSLSDDWTGDELAKTAYKEGYAAGYNWYKSGHALNVSNPTGVWNNSSAWGTTAALKGYSVIYAPGFDDIMGYSAYAYFFGKAAENDGWYFTGWSYTEGESDLGGVVGTADSTMFRVSPSSTAGEANYINRSVYATFKPVMVSNYKVNGLINKSVSPSTTITFDVVGERVSTADFTVSVPEANFSAALTSCVANKVTVTVTYSGSSDGEFRGNVTLASKSGCSQLTAPVYARVGSTGSYEAILYDGKTPTSTTGTLSAMISAANGTKKIVTLNKNIEAATTVNANVTINFNGYNIANTLTVSGGEVTVAYSKYGGGANILSVTGGKAILNGGEFATLSVGASGTVEQNGATFTAASSNGGTLITAEGRFEAGLTSNGTLTVNGGTFEGATAITVSGGTATINKGTVSGENYGIQATSGTTNITSNLVSVYGGTNAVKQTSGTVNLTNGKFVGNTAPLAGTINLQAGYFKVDGEHLGIAVPSGKKVLNVLAGTEFAEGYRYFIGDDASSVGVCRIGTTAYTTLEDALAYANNTGETVTIIMTNDYTLPANYYTLPANATLIIPMSNEQEVAYPIVNRVSNNSASGTPYVQPTEFRRLTFAAGVNMDVHGLIEVTGTQRASDDAYATLPHGPYGLLVMNEGSHMTLQNGSELRVWGYMIGQGETDARRGSTVREQFQMGDWKGGSVSFSMLAAEDTRVFPITQYYIQNIESPVKYHPGAVLSTTTSVSANYGSIGMTAMANDIKVVGVSGQHTAMFLMDNEADAENTWVRKWYDAEHDIQTYEVNSGAHLGSMVLDLGKLGTEPLVMNSGYFVLPITNNMKIHLLSGLMDFTQTTSLLPGAEVEIDKESVIKIVRNSNPNVFSGSLYVYDADDWGKANGKGDAGTLYTKVVPYSPSFGGKPNIRTETAKPADAKINVHGSFDTGQGSVYTTPGGANIFSTNEDAGTFIFTKAAPEETSSVYQYKGMSGNVPTYTSVAAESAKLKNGAGAAESYTATTGTSGNQVFMYMDGAWKSPNNGTVQTFYFDCFAADIDMDVYAAEAEKKVYHDLYSQPVSYDLGSSAVHLYIKPQEWVEIVGTAEIEFDWSETPDPSNDPYDPYLIGITGNDDHTFSDAAGAGRLFILMDKGCQWWEVEKKDNLYHCIHPDNDTYYYWGEDENGEEKWLEKKFTITWRNWDGTELKFYDAENNEITYDVTYGTMAEYLGSNPTREPSLDYTYDFTGWTPALGPVTSDVTYTATYAQKERKYTIIFLQEGGVEIERQFLTHNQMPSCINTPTRVGYTLEWSPAIKAVTGDATYTATWLEEPPTAYQITFYDYNGTTELQKGSVNVGVVPTPPANPSGKPQTSEFTYVFDHWSPALEEVSATSAKSYTAVYREADRTYTISYYRENGSTLITTQELPYGATPTPPAVTKENPATGHTYTLVWKNLAGTSTIQTVMGNASYKPTYIDELNKYTVTVKSNPSGACAISGAGLYGYNTSATLTLSVNDGYSFTGWSDGIGGTNTSRTITVTEDKELVANFTVADPDYTITWKNESGSANLVTPVGQKANTATIYTGAIPTKDATAAKTFTFDGWTTAANGAGTYYKNGMTPKATANATYYAHFKEEARKYNVLWKNAEGTATIEQDLDQAYGAKIAYNSATPTKQATAQYTYAFDGWSTTIGGAKVTLPATVTGDATFYAHFATTTKTYTITFIRDDGSLIDKQEVAYGTTPTHTDPTKPATEDCTFEFDAWDRAFTAVTGLATYTASFNSVCVDNLIIGVNGVEDLDDQEETRRDLIITSNGVSSGQLLGASNLTLTGDAIFRLQKTFNAGEWYAVAVPWTVNVGTGIYAGGSRLGTGAIYVIEFDAVAYADATREDRNYWNFLGASDNMVPGKLYMIYLSAAQSALEFHKTSGSLLTTTTTLAPAAGSVAEQSHWNAIANPALYHANLNTGADDDDVLKYNGDDSYTLGSTSNMIVGEPMFVQVNSSVTIDAIYSGGSGMPAYHRAPATKADNRFVLDMTHNDQLADRIIVQTADEKANEYVIGKDLSKMGVSNKVAQMWMERYDTKLCKNTVELNGQQAEYPLNIFAPASGEYVLSVVQERGDAVLYLTYNGRPIWNLSNSEFVFNLEKGTTAEYGLRLIVKAPQIGTGIEETIVDSKDASATKVLINDQVLIIRGDRTYTIDGQLVK